jgi:PqqD family protein of HPr-rel-A system
LGDEQTDHTGPNRFGPRAAHVLVSELDGDLTLYDSQRNEVHVLNATAGDIWRLLDGEHDLDEIVADLAAAYDVAPDVVRPHVVATLSTFAERGLLAEDE